MMDWAQEEWAGHLRQLRQSWQEAEETLKKEPEMTFGEQRLLISRWVDFLERWSTSHGGVDDGLQGTIDTILPEAARAVALDPLDFWFKVTMLWNWRRTRKQDYEDEYRMFVGGGHRGLGESVPER